MPSINWKGVCIINKYLSLKKKKKKKKAENCVKGTRYAHVRTSEWNRAPDAMSHCCLFSILPQCQYCTLSEKCRHGLSLTAVKYKLR